MPDESEQCAETGAAQAAKRPARPGMFRRFLSLLLDYDLRDRWRVTGSAEEVAAIFMDTSAIHTWWPQYLTVTVVEPGDDYGLGRVFRIRVKGWAPHTMQLEFRVVEVRYPEYFAVEVEGSIEGRGSGSLVSSGPELVIDFELKVRVRGRFLQIFSFFLKPIFAAHHRYVMRRGELGLRDELQRRRTATSQPP